MVTMFPHFPPKCGACVICDRIQIKTLSRGLFSYQLSAISYQLSAINHHRLLSLSLAWRNATKRGTGCGHEYGSGIECNYERLRWFVTSSYAFNGYHLFIWPPDLVWLWLYSDQKSLSRKDWSAINNQTINVTSFSHLHQKVQLFNSWNFLND